MKFSYCYETNDTISEKMLHKVEIFSFNCTSPLGKSSVKHVINTFKKKRYKAEIKYCAS